MAWRQKTQQLTKLTILITLKTGDQQKSIKIKRVINKLKFDSRNQNYHKINMNLVPRDINKDSTFRRPEEGSYILTSLLLFIINLIIDILLLLESKFQDNLE